ncbi:hypothetical protein [Hymenobacter elongatus]|uniref:STAS/SEC14 domain-containing protein n=1 Tax=Hymenobacter elongatus TaxID=877208 RepID=A0A4Z0PGN0_9BACT|nr:hypothetical protein [Hymenobacter elongatus]TGE14295.1 hypothetical protein E5J99_16915 [Hymenobacter elongatus]
MRSAADLPAALATTYRADLNMLVGRWGYQPAVGLLPDIYQDMKQQALSTGCRFWLQDIRRREFNDPEITRWLLTEFFPDMSQLLGGRLAVAYLTSPALLLTIMTGPGFLPPSAYDNQPFGIAFFGDEGECINWLREQQRRGAQY